MIKVIGKTNNDNILKMKLVDVCSWIEYWAQWRNTKRLSFGSITGPWPSMGLLQLLWKKEEFRRTKRNVERWTSTRITMDGDGFSPFISWVEQSIQVQLNRDPPWWTTTLPSLRAPTTATSLGWSQHPITRRLIMYGSSLTWRGPSPRSYVSGLSSLSSGSLALLRSNLGWLTMIKLSYCLIKQFYFHVILFVWKIFLALTLRTH
jgi:hypothetical protein